MIEDCDPRLGPAKLAAGAVCWRWTVLRPAAPAQRRQERAADAPTWQRRVRVRCACGHIDTVWERDVVRGRSRGCRRASCRHEFEKEVRMQIDKALEERLAKLVKSKEAKQVELRASVARLEGEASAIDEEIATIERTRALLREDKAGG
jgi:hypothetical protein